MLINVLSACNSRMTAHPDQGRIRVSADDRVCRLHLVAHERLLKMHDRTLVMHDMHCKVLVIHDNTLFAAYNH